MHTFCVIIDRLAGKILTLRKEYIMMTADRNVPWSIGLEMKERKELQEKKARIDERERIREEKLCKLYDQIRNVENQMRYIKDVGKGKVPAVDRKMYAGLERKRDDLEFHVRRVKAGIE